MPNSTVVEVGSQVRSRIKVTNAETRGMKISCVDDAIHKYTYIVDAVARAYYEAYASWVEIDDLRQLGYLAIVSLYNDGKLNCSHAAEIVQQHIRSDLYQYCKNEHRQLNAVEHLEDINVFVQLNETGHDLIIDALHKLPPILAEVLYKSYFDEMTIAQISRELQIPGRDVSTRINKGLLRMRHPNISRKLRGLL